MTVDVERMVDILPRKNDAPEKNGNPVGLYDR